MKIIIIGASSGLGLGIARTYINRGHSVGITARRESPLKELAEGNDKVEYATMDVRQIEQSVATLQNLISRLHGIDLLILCAGIGRMNPLLEAEVESNTVQTNVLGWTAIVDFAFNYFLQQGHGHLAAITSFAALRGLAPAPSYSASKAYQSHYLEALRQRCIADKRPIFITDIRPGFVKTPLLSNPEKLFWVLNADKAVRHIVRAIDCRAAVRTLSKRWRCLAPLFKIAPNYIIAKIVCR